MNKQAELISIGNELLSGRTLNTHAKDLGGALAAIGLQLIRDTTVPDQTQIIGSALIEALGRTHLVFISGGLGPTVDDITREALAEKLGRKIILDSETVASLAERYATREQKMPPAAARQALVLEGATVLPNSVGAAPGQRIDLPENRSLFILPGPPREFNTILNEEIIPWLKLRFPDAAPKCIRIVQTQGIGESDIVTLLEKNNFQPRDIALGFYPAHGKVEIHLTAEPSAGKKVVDAEQTLRHLLGNYLESN